VGGRGQHREQAAAAGHGGISSIGHDDAIRGRVAPPSPAEIRHFQSLVNPKDAHEVAAAVAAKAPWLLSLDQPFLREVEAAPITLRGLTPGAFITTVLPAHPDAAHLRN
jgi:hypothetical protein